MLIDSVIIRLIKSGAGVDSGYSLSIYGTGKVLYEGAEKVKVKGVVESSIDKDKILLLLSEFKEKGFFSLSDSYGEEDTNIRPYTKISISFQKKDGENVAKRVRYNKGDINVPKELIALEDKIVEIVNASKWIGTPSDYKEYEEKKEPEKIVKSIDHAEKDMPKESSKKKSGKLVTMAAVLAIVAMIIIAVYFGIFSQPPQENESPNGTNINYPTPVITVFKTASNITSIGVYDYLTVFNQSDRVWIYQEYANISTINNQTCNITINLTVKDSNGIIRHIDVVNKSEVGNYGQAWWFVTDESWPIDVYDVISTLTDNISNKNATGKTSFALI